MPKANFYLMKQTGDEARSLLACRLAEQQALQGQRVYLHAANAEDAAALDQLLWQYTPESFLPHALQSEPLSKQAQICIGCGPLPAGFHCVFNLGTEPLPADCPAAAVAEFVLNDDSEKARGRALWQTYKQRDWPLQHHAL